MSDISKDVDGKVSSKRKMGIRLVNVSLVMAIIHFLSGIVNSFRGVEFNYSFPFDMWITLLGMGASLLGITLVERFSTNKTK